MPEGIIVLRDEDRRPVDQQRGQVDNWWVIKDNPVLSGSDIKNPEQNFENGAGGPPIVTMDFSDKGRKAFADTTRRIAQRGADNAAINGGLQDPIGASHHFAIRLDNELISTPYINFRENPDGIDGSQGAQISGGFTIQTAQDLARLLKIGALPLRLDLISRSQVSATLGRQALDQGLIAGLAGFAIVALFLLVFYRVLGVIAVLALGIYALYFFALIKLIPITLTLPGIAGLILTIGVAADANIVIFERVKEEIRNGRSISAGIAQGYKKGFATIVDANIVTLLVAFILFILATAGVKGFAFVLGIGTMVSLFTAVLATQAILLIDARLARCCSARRRSARARSASRSRSTSWAHSKWFFSMSGVILLVCALAIGSKGLNFGIDFESGTRITAALSKPATVEQVRDAVSAGRLRRRQDPDRSRNKELGPNVVQISAEESGRTEPGDAGAAVARFGIRGEPEVTEIGPDVRQDRRQLGADRDHRLAERDLDLHRAALRVEVRRAGADRADARHPDHGGRLRPHRPGGDDVDGRGAAHHPGLLALRHDHRVRPHPRERPADAERRLLADRQPLDERGHRALAGDVVLHDPAGADAVPVRRRHAEGLRVRADHRHAVGRLLVGLHREPGARALEGARAGLPHAPGADPRAARLRARLRGRDGGRAGRRRAASAAAPASRSPPRRTRRRSRAAEFDDMVRNLGVDEAQRASRRPPPRAARRRPARAGARRRRHRQPAPGPAARAERAGGTGGGDEAEEAAQPPPREASLMGALVWVMMGLAIWHFTIFIPDRFWAGIVGAFLGALFGAVLFGLAVNGFTVPGQNDTDLITAARGDPGRADRHRRRLLLRRVAGQRAALAGGVGADRARRGARPRARRGRPARGLEPAARASG